MKIKTTKNLTDDFDDEIEAIFLEKGIISNEEMVYEGHTIGRVPFASHEDEIAFIREKCIVVEDDINFYIVASEKDVLNFDGDDFIVQKCQKDKYQYLEI